MLAAECPLPERTSQGLLKSVEAYVPNGLMVVTYLFVKQSQMAEFQFGVRVSKVLGGT